MSHSHPVLLDIKLIINELYFTSKSHIDALALLINKYSHHDVFLCPGIFIVKQILSRKFKGSGIFLRL